MRNSSGIKSVKDLKGKKVATPFVSTAHYQLMAIMKVNGVDAKDVNVMNLRPPEIAAAWERGGAEHHLHLGPGPDQDQGQRQDDRIQQDHRRQGFPDLRRPGGQRQVGRRK